MPAVAFLTSFLVVKGGDCKIRWYGPPGGDATDPFMCQYLPGWESGPVSTYYQNFYAAERPSSPTDLIPYDVTWFLKPVDVIAHGVRLDTCTTGRLHPDLVSFARKKFNLPSFTRTFYS